MRFNIPGELGQSEGTRLFRTLKRACLGGLCVTRGCVRNSRSPARCQHSLGGRPAQTHALLPLHAGGKEGRVRCAANLAHRAGREEGASHQLSGSQLERKWRDSSSKSFFKLTKRSVLTLFPGFIFLKGMAGRRGLYYAGVSWCRPSTACFSKQTPWVTCGQRTSEQWPWATSRHGRRLTHL